jgi:hypothetical protein
MAEAMGEFRQAYIPKPRVTIAFIAQAERLVLIVRVDLRQKPDALAERCEKSDDRPFSGLSAATLTVGFERGLEARDWHEHDHGSSFEIDGSIVLIRNIALRC